MKSNWPGLFFCAVFCCATVGAVAQDDEARERVVDIEGGAKAAIFTDTISKDGSCAAGWTIARVDKKALPVDWTKFNTAGYGGGETRDAQNPDAPYEVVYCAVDLKGKRIAPLPMDSALNREKDEGKFTARWGPETKGRRYAFITNDGRWEAWNLWLVAIDAKGMKVTDSMDELSSSVRDLLQKVRPVEWDRYVISYGGVAFAGETASVSFSAQVPKSMEADEVTGRLVVRLADGHVQDARSDMRADDPFETDAVLKKADAELNKVFAELSLALPRTRTKALAQEEIDWLRQRNRDAIAAGEKAANDAVDERKSDAQITAAGRRARDNSLVESTRKRTEELKSALAIARHGGK